MIKNYLKTAWRSLMKNKVFSFINIAGLSIGIAACLLILQYVSFQLSFDQFNKNADDIYRVYNDRYQQGKLIQHGTISYSGIGPAMQKDFPEVENYTRVVPWGQAIVSYNNSKIGDQDLLFVENSFLNMFTYPVIAGDKRTALTEPKSVVISQSLANKIFHVSNNDYSNVLGKQIKVGNDFEPFKITAICEDAPENSHLKFEVLGSYSTLYTGPWKEAQYDFTDSDFWTYIQLKHGTNYKTVEAKLPAFSQKYFQGNKISGSDEKFFLQPLSKAHLYSDFEYEIGKTASSTVVWGLVIIAALIIVIAWVNYINLATAKSMERAKEVGVRKVAGATRQQLIRQFLTESFIINIIALSIAILMVTLVQQSFNGLVQYQLSLSYLFAKGLNGYSISITLIALMISGILISGFYPAFVLSSFKPIQVLKGRFTSSNKGILLRRILVVGQFAITIALIICSVVVYKQMQYVSSQDLGMNMSQTLIIKPPELTNWDSTFITKEDAFTTELQKINGVKAAATSWNIPGGDIGRSFNVRRGDQPENMRLTMRHTGISIGFVDLYQIKLLAGRDFVKTDFNPDFEKVDHLLLNESAIKLLGFSSPQEAIGKTVYRGNKKFEVVGVIKDYHQKSLRFPVEPTLLMPAYSTGSSISVKADTKNLPATIAAVKQQFDAFFPGNLFDYFFLDDHFNNQYSSDVLFGKVFSIFSAFAILIACLGLLGLSLFTTMQRTKEIGVRKILGASVSNIVMLLSKDFIKLVLIAFLIASPVAWYIMHNWLNGFAYRTGVSVWIFIIAGMLSMIVALATISFQSIKAAITNPVKSLRTE